eukprot:g19359.t2
MDSSLPKILELRYCRSFPGEHFRWVTRWAMSRNGHPTETDTAEAFNALYRDDCYTLGYHPAQGECGRVSLQLNGTELGAVEGRSFSEAIFSDHRPFYLLAVQEWTARMCPTSGEDNTAKGHAKAAPLICIPSRHPLFFTWESETFQGNQLVFCGLYDADDHRKHQLTYRHVLGQCVVHCGKQRHGAVDIEEGERASLIIWTKSHAFRRSAEYRALYDLDRWKLGKARLANFLSTDPRIPTEESGDPVGEVTKYYEQALWRFKMDVVVFLTMDIFIALGVLLCLKELGFK